MEILFENRDFVLKSTGHDFDFVGIIETNTDKPLTFFFSYETDDEGEVLEDTYELIDVYSGLQINEDKDEEDEAECIVWRKMMMYDNVEYFTTRDDGHTGFLSNPNERGAFLALIKNYCPERLKDIAWA